MADIASFAAGVLFSVGQYLLARKMLFRSRVSNLGALYIVQRLILSFGFLALVMALVSTAALLWAAIGLVVTAIVLPLAFSRKG